MNAIAVSKSSRRNLLEGIALTALFQGVPTFTLALPLLKLAGGWVAGPTSVAVAFVVLGALLQGVLMPWLGPKFPRFFSNSYQPLFFDNGLSLSQKLRRWRTLPVASLQLALLAVILVVLAVMSWG